MDRKTRHSADKRNDSIQNCAPANPGPLTDCDGSVKMCSFCSSSTRSPLQSCSYQLNLVIFPTGAIEMKMERREANTIFYQFNETLLGIRNVVVDYD